MQHTHCAAASMTRLTRRFIAKVCKNAAQKVKQTTNIIWELVGWTRDDLFCLFYQHSGNVGFKTIGRCLKSLVED